MAFDGGAPRSTFMPDFWLNAVLRGPQLQLHPTHRDFPHALTANHKHHPRIQFAASLILTGRDAFGQTADFNMFAWYQIATTARTSNSAHNVTSNRPTNHDNIPT